MFLAFLLDCSDYFTEPSFFFFWPGVCMFTTSHQYSIASKTCRLALSWFFLPFSLAVSALLTGRLIGTQPLFKLTFRNSLTTRLDNLAAFWLLKSGK
jgi:hypothetical protein